MSNNAQLKSCKHAVFASKKRAMNITKNLGMLLLAIYLILAGITLLLHITIPTIVMGILALAAGILISLANSNITLGLHGEPSIGTDSLTPNFSDGY